MKTDTISILAVDDEEAFLQLIKAMLSNEGYKVEVAKDGVLAINALQQHNYDLVLLDIKLHFSRLYFLEVQDVIDQTAQSIDIPFRDT